jgi:hypothetical protein
MRAEVSHGGAAVQVKAYSRAVCKIASLKAPMLVLQNEMFCTRHLASAESSRGA